MAKRKNYKSLAEKRRDLEILRSQLDLEQSSFMSHWRQLADFIMPRRARFTLTDNNRGDKRNQNIISCVATLALRTLRSGMMSGVTSPARPWFRLTVDDAELAESGAVKVWLQQVRDRMITTMLRSNLYKALPQVYGDMGCFGTAAMYVQEDLESVFRCYTFPVGSYKISLNDRLKVDTFMREYRITVRQLVEEYGMTDEYNPDKIDWSNISSHVRSQWDQGHREAWIDIVHVIYPNPEFNRESPLAKHKRYASCTYERGTGGREQYLMEADQDKFLEETGYDLFPVLCPRWEVAGEDVYGTDCPGMTALGDIKALQMMSKKKAKAVDKKIDPPMIGPTSLKNAKVTLLPGDTTFLDEREGQAKYRPAHETNIGIQEIRADINEITLIIQRAFYEDLFLMLANSDRRQITAREIDERHEEKLLAVGPVLEQINDDLLDPLIDIVFAYMVKQGMIPPAPEELQDMPLRVEYISYMAQAQKLAHVSGIERFVQFAGGVAAFDPSALQKINTDQVLDVYAELVAVDATVVRTDDEVAAIREQMAKQQQAQQMSEMMAQGSKTAKDLSQADMEGDNALTRLIGGGAAEAA